ncbi:MAG: hypothetical protein EXQ93_06575 [Alphaproteobacteria bacterium]|nr:hypothetical protein [Alphaproteobacteria bacterium]
MKAPAVFLAVAMAATPAFAIHDAAVEDALGFCVTDAFTLVEAIVTYREGIVVAVHDIGPQPNQAADKRVVEAVQTATAGGVIRMLDALSGCMEGIAPRLAQNPAAYTQAQAVEAELELALEEIDALREALDQAHEFVVGKWGANAVDLATLLLADYWGFAGDLGDEILQFTDDIKVVIDKTRPR